MKNKWHLDFSIELQPQYHHHPLPTKTSPAITLNSTPKTTTNNDFYAFETKPSDLLFKTNINQNIFQTNMTTIQGKYAKIEDKKDRVIHAKFDHIKECTLDPKGYFLIKYDAEKKKLHAGYCTAQNELVAEIIGNNAEEVYMTILREGFVSRLDHAAYLGKELEKAELAMKLNKKYVQDSPLEL